MLDMFYDKEKNPLDAQLICTTHNPNLIEKGIRRDQVWLIDKNHKGQSSMYRLSDKKVRPNENYSQKYLQGLFGAIPEFEEIK